MTYDLPVKDKSEGAIDLKIAPFRREVRKTVPHKHNNYFEIIYLSKGSGFHLIDHQRHGVKPPVVFFIRREQVHGFELDDDSDSEGFVLIVKKPFIDKSSDLELKSFFTWASNHACLQLHDSESVSRIFNLLAKENEAGVAVNRTVNEGLLKALLAKLSVSAKPALKDERYIKSDIYQNYLGLLSAEKPVKRQVLYYATLLNTTPQNLNAVCRKAANQAAADLIANFIISEAKRLLIYTANTISEIAFVLDFNDASHFIKYFKRFTGVTPQSYRLIP